MAAAEDPDSGAAAAAVPSYGYLGDDSSEGSSTPMERPEFNNLRTLSHVNFDEDDDVHAFAHHESIYSFMVLFPELYRLKFGSYWNKKVFVAVALFVVNAAMQITLTQVTGLAILSDNLAYVNSLVNSRPSAVEAILLGHTETIDDWVNGETEESGCCRGGSCSRQAVCCSPRCRGNASAGNASAGLPSGSSSNRSNSSMSQLKVRLSSQRGQRHGADSFLGLDEPTQGHSFAAKPGGSGSGGPGGAGGKSAKGHRKSEVHQTRQTVCYADNHSSAMDCSPPSLRFAKRWDLLDFDGDGVWTMEEAEADEANLRCFLADSGLTPRVVFRSTSRSIVNFFDSGSHLLQGKDDEDDLSKEATVVVPDSIQRREAIPYKWFRVWEGMVKLCMVADMNRCGKLISAGIFDGALRSEGLPGGLKNLNAALDFCQEALRENGICDRSLPVTFVMYRNQMKDKCGVPHFSAGPDYHSPVDPDDWLQTVQVSYEKLGTFEMAASMTFRFFLMLILMIWFINLLSEITAIINLFDFCYNIPICDGDPFKSREMLSSVKQNTLWAAHRAKQRVTHIVSWKSSGEEDGADKGTPRPTPRPQLMPFADVVATPRDNDGAIVIPSISRPHLVTCYLMVIIRTLIMIYMAVVGSVFILTTYSYPDLLMNAVALAFVFELPAFLYTLLVSRHDKDLLDAVKPLEFATSLPTTRGPWLKVALSAYFLGLVVFPIFSLFLVVWDMRANIDPATEALECLCFQQGDRCAARPFFEHTSWDSHWREVGWIFTRHIRPN